MWTSTYLVLLLVRLYFTLSPSYIHPDEIFQGPEVVAGEIFGFRHDLPWEFTASSPVRSVFPLWPVFALPMLVLKGIWAGIGPGKNSLPPPYLVYICLRLVFFVLSFVLEDWAIHELVQSPRHRRLAVTLVASSYVTWTYQTHTFSNAIETIAALWVLVLVQRMIGAKRTSLTSSALLGIILAFGVFNRITFPAFVFIPCALLLPHFLAYPISFIVTIGSALGTAFLAIAADTEFYKPDAGLTTLWRQPVITPLNSLRYNSQTANLADHGLHPFYQHLTVSLPLLLGPALLLLPSIRFDVTSLPIVLAMLGTIFLSLVPHQEPRFLLPMVPLLLILVHLPRSRTRVRIWLVLWIAFNVILAVLMGRYHQGGVIPAQTWIGQHLQTRVDEVFWWRTYSPPAFLLGHNTLPTTNLMGMAFPEMQAKVTAALECQANRIDRAVGIVAPWSSLEFDQWQHNNSKFDELWRTHTHVNLDDLDVLKDGLISTVRRVVGRCGLVIWRLSRRCSETS